MINPISEKKNVFFFTLVQRRHKVIRFSGFYTIPEPKSIDKVQIP